MLSVQGVPRLTYDSNKSGDVRAYRFTQYQIKTGVGEPQGKMGTRWPVHTFCYRGKGAVWREGESYAVMVVTVGHGTGSIYRGGWSWWVWPVLQ